MRGNRDLLLGARLVARTRTQRQLVVALGLGGVGIGAGVCLPAAFPFVLASVIGFLIGGASNGVQNVAQQALVRLRTPDELRGRVFAAAGKARSPDESSGLLATR